MPRILLDANMPIGLRAALPTYEVVTAFEMGWGALENGKLLSAAKAAGFSVMITGDQNIRHQQNLSELQIAIVVVSTNLWPTIREHLTTILEAVQAATPGSYTSVTLGRPALRRRPFIPRAE